MKKYSNLIISFSCAALLTFANSTFAATASVLCMNQSTGKLLVRTKCKKGEISLDSRTLSNLVSVTAERGPRGDIGDRGPQGEAGPVGAKGDTGVSGETGIKGETGAQGAQGLQGPKGDKGEKGDSIATEPFLFVYDSSGQPIGPVTDFSCNSIQPNLAPNYDSAVVVIKFDGSFYPICVTSAGFMGNTDIFYTSLDCTGDTYTSVIGPQTAWSESSLFSASVVGGSSSSKILYRPNFALGKQSTIVRSARNSEGSCSATGTYSLDSYRLIQVADLSSLYQAPLALK